MTKRGLARLFGASSLWALVGIVSCSRRHHEPDEAAPSSSGPKATPVSSTAPLGEPRRGMVFVQGGALVAGSPPNSIPRRPDRELSGEQVVMKGFYLDIFAYPNEEGAIPLSGVTVEQAMTLCKKEGKRLCTELEWERACKGPLNNTYSWGNDYRSEVCRTGTAVTARPAGLLVGCRSAFGMRDSHGGLFEWTMSRWQRPGLSTQVAVRGGNGTFGDMAARCANVEPRAPNKGAADVGFRCCAGPVNTAEVVLDRHPTEPLTRVERIDRTMVDRIVARLDSAAFADLGTQQFDVVARFVWYPIANEKLELLTVCGKAHYPRLCGLVVARDTLGQSTVLGWGSTGYVASKMHRAQSSRDLWLLGSDDYGQFKRLVRYAWGAVEVGPKERLLSKGHGDDDDEL